MSDYLSHPVTSASADRVNEWLSVAMTKAVCSPLEGTDTFTATLPPFRKFAAVAASESLALESLRGELAAWARNELILGHALPTWENNIPEVSTEARVLVRVSNLKHLLRVRAREWGAERMNLPAGVVERCLAEIDAVVSRHAMTIQNANA